MINLYAQQTNRIMSERKIDLSEWLILISVSSLYVFVCCYRFLCVCVHARSALGTLGCWQSCLCSVFDQACETVHIHSLYLFPFLCSRTRTNTHLLISSA